MPSPRVDLVMEGRIFSGIERGLNNMAITREIKRITGKEITEKRVRNARRRKEEGKENATPTKRGPGKITKDKVTRLKLFSKSDNPITQREMAGKLGCTQPTVNYYMNKIGIKKKKKKKVQRLTEANKRQRLEKGPELKEIFEKNKLKIMTCDESIFSLQLGGGKRDFYYEVPGNKKEDRQPSFFEREENFSPSLMVWCGISYNSKTSLHFVKPGVKINGVYYQTVIKEGQEKDVWQ